MAKTWTLTTGSSATPGAVGGMNVARIASTELFTVGADAGLAIAAGGVNARTTDGAGTDTFGTCEPVTNIAQTTQSATDLFTPSTTLFTATGVLNQDRAGYGSAILNSGTFANDLAVFGGDCGNGSLASWVIGTAAAGTPRVTSSRGCPPRRSCSRVTWWKRRPRSTPGTRSTVTGCRAP